MLTNTCMKKYLFAILSFLLFHSVNAADKDSTIYYNLPDSVKAIQFLADIKITVVGKKEATAGISTDVVRLFFESDKKARSIKFEFPKRSPVMANGLNTRTTDKDEIEWKYDWNTNEVYKLLIATISDSAGNFSLYSGYVFLPEENKWKLIGTCKINGRRNTIQQPASFVEGKENDISVSIDQVWVQRNNNSWKNIKGLAPSASDLNGHATLSSPAPFINLYGHFDSVAQRDLDLRIIKVAITNGKTDVKENMDGVYYSMMKEGSGRQVSVNDTVTIFYKGYLFANDSIFDETKEKPVTFPLKRLIRGWQIGVPLCKVGGKIKLVIPSDLAYSIRTRSSRIPPNSILVFEIEVLNAKSP